MNKGHRQTRQALRGSAPAVGLEPQSQEVFFQDPLRAGGMEKGCVTYGKDNYTHGTNYYTHAINYSRQQLPSRRGAQGQTARGTGSEAMSW